MVFYKVGPLYEGIRHSTVEGWRAECEHCGWLSPIMKYNVGAQAEGATHHCDEVDNDHA